MSFKLSLIFLIATGTCVAHASMLSSRESASDKSSPNYFYLGVNFAPVITSANDSIRTFGGSFAGEGPADTSTVFGYDARFTAGPIFFNHILLGFSYNMRSEVTHRNSSPSGDTTRNADLESREFGPTLGFLLGHWQLKATWIVSSKKVNDNSEANDNGSASSNTETQNYDGHGWEFELGYAFEIFDWLSIGPNLVFRHVKYGLQSMTDNLTPGNSYYGKPFSDKADEGSFDPMILMTVKF
jgi:hypothetical protein